VHVTRYDDSFCVRPFSSEIAAISDLEVVVSRFLLSERETFFSYYMYCVYVIQLSVVTTGSQFNDT